MPELLVFGFIFVLLLGVGQMWRRAHGVGRSEDPATLDVQNHVGDETQPNAPRCDIGRDPRCRNQAAGWWVLPVGRIALCEDDKLDLADQGVSIGAHEWKPLHPDPVQFAIDRRLSAMAAGYFG
jgi:hypothetical protein